MSPSQLPIIADHPRNDTNAPKTHEDALRQAAVVFAIAAEGMIITDLDARILEVNPAFTEITGYPRDAVIGRNPRFLQSGRHGPEVYQAMWTALLEFGHWRGEIWNRRQCGEVYPQWLTISRVVNDTGQPKAYVGVFTDISQLKRSEERLQYLAHHDPLTGLPNRLLFHARLTHALEQATRHQEMLALLFLDLDRFKTINDVHGHPAGDALLREIAQRLQDQLLVTDTVARIGGDEFVMVLEGIAEAAQAGLIAHQILERLQQPIRILDQDHFITASIGISLYPSDGQDAATLTRNAETALHRVKECGRHDVLYYRRELTVKVAERATLENHLHQALERGQLRVYYQPQIDLRSGRLIGAEALLRWQHPTRGLTSPTHFIHIAEDSSLIIGIGQWVMETACRQAAVWLDQGIELERISVNVAGRQISRGDLARVAEAALSASALPPERLEIEVTEGFIMREPERAIALLGDLREIGISLAIDDFGTGHSSLSYLKRLPLDRLKIDQSFIRDLPRDTDDAAITRAVLALGSGLQLQIVAEGIETLAQQAFLIAESCAQGQGFLFSRPVPAERFEQWLRRRQKPTDR